MGMILMRPPSGILYVGGYLNKHGFSVKIHHIRESEVDKTVDEISKSGPVLFVGFSIMTGMQVTVSAEMSIKLKKSDPQMKVVWGGIHPSLLPDDCLNYDFVDYVVIGEGEVSALDLAMHLSENSRYLLENIKGIGFKKDGKSVIAEPRPFEKNIDEFCQDWSLVNINDYVIGGNLFCFITSRGCPHSCGFCYNQKFNSRKWRSHSISKVVSELLAIKKLTGISLVYFSDDNFFTDRKRGLEILRELKQHGITCVGLEVRVDYITEDLVQQMVDLGVQSIFFGWESGCEKTLEKVSKGFSPALILERLKILAKFKELHVDCSAIIAFPWETDEDVSKTVSFTLKMFHINPFQLAIYLHTYLPYPGAPITSEAIACGFHFPKDYKGWSKFDELADKMELPWLSRKQIKKYALFNRYANLLHVPKLGKSQRAIRYIFALFAYARLKTRVLFFPFEIWVFDHYDKKNKREQETTA